MAWYDQIGQSLAGVNDWTQTPEGRAATLQFGLSMLSPQPRGQGFLSTLASSIGQGAEASGRTREVQLSEAEKRRQAEMDLQKEARANKALGIEEQKAATEASDVASKIKERSIAPGGFTAAMLNARNRGTDYVTDLASRMVNDTQFTDKPLTWDEAYTKASAIYATQPQAPGGGSAAPTPGAQGGGAGVPPPAGARLRWNATRTKVEIFQNGQWVPAPPGTVIPK